MKKLISTILTVALALSLAGCTFKSPATVLTVNDWEVPAGIYLVYQYQAYSLAKDKAEDTKKDLFKQDIEGVSAKEWIHTETISNIKYNYLINEVFDDSKLELLQDEETMRTQADIRYNNNEKMFMKNGIGIDTYFKYYVNAMKSNQYFTDVFSTAEENKLTDEEIVKYTTDNYTHVASLLLPVTTPEYTPLDDEKKSEINKLAKELEDKLSGGASLSTELATEYLEKAFKITGHEMTDTIVEQYYVREYITENSTQYPQELLDEYLAAKVGDIKTSEASGNPVVWEKLEAFETDEELEEFRSSITSTIHMEKYNEFLSEETKDYTIKENASAVNTYSSKKVKLT